MGLYEIVYQSRAIKELSVEDFYKLMVKSREYNLEYRITGCLIYHNLTFIQALEGTKKDVYDLFNNIANDKRHTQINIVWEGEIVNRGFEGWSMSLMNLSENGLEDVFSDFLDTGKFTYDVPGMITTAKSLLLNMKDSL